MKVTSPITNCEVDGPGLPSLLGPSRDTPTSLSVEPTGKNGLSEEQPSRIKRKLSFESVLIDVQSNPGFLPPLAVPLEISLSLTTAGTTGVAHLIAVASVSGEAGMQSLPLHGEPALMGKLTSQLEAVPEDQISSLPQIEQPGDITPQQQPFDRNELGQFSPSGSAQSSAVTQEPVSPETVIPNRESVANGSIKQPKSAPETNRTEKLEPGPTSFNFDRIDSDTISQSQFDSEILPSEFQRDARHDHANPNDRAARVRSDLILPDSTASRLDQCNETVSNPATLIDQISTSVQSHGEELRQGQPIEIHLRLDPPELGTVRVHLRLVDGVVSVRFIAGDEAASRMLEANLPDLRQSLAERGLAFSQNDSAGNRQPHQPQETDQPIQLVHRTGLRRSTPWALASHHRQPITRTSHVDVWA